MIRQFEKNRIVLGLFFVSMALAAAYGVHRLHGYVVGQALPIRSIAVTGTSTDERAQEVAFFADVSRGAPLLGVDADAVAAKVALHPYVEAASVHRVGTDAIEIRVIERQAVAVARFSHTSGMFLVDKAGIAFKRVTSGEGGDLPVLMGAAITDLPAAMEALAIFAAPAGACNGVIRSLFWRGQEAELVYVDGTEVRVDTSRLAESFNRYSKAMVVLQRKNLRASRVYTVGHRLPERVAVRLRPLAEKPKVEENQDRESGT